ncbi:MAG TPA: hypothetical protein PL070_05220, partial [Flavobacteriales bacterium]|nr:hypothetical protein [Flavobacteriales bacterium]
MVRLSGILALLFVGLPFVGGANDTIVVANDRYTVDSDLALVLISGGVADINAQHTGSKGTIALGHYYTFNEPPTELAVGTGYAVQDEEGAEHTLYFTDLPVIWLDSPNTIVDEPKVPGSFRMVAA